jgi:hypothetical protein
MQHGDSIEKGPQFPTVASGTHLTGSSEVPTLVLVITGVLIDTVQDFQIADLFKVFRNPPFFPRIVRQSQETTLHSHSWAYNSAPQSSGFFFLIYQKDICTRKF